MLVPFIGNNLVTEPQKASVAGVISLTGYGLLAAVIVLTMMIAPLMVSIFSDGLRSVKPGWLGGLAGARRQPLAHHLEDRRPQPPGRRSSPAPYSRPRGRSARR